MTVKQELLIAGDVQAVGYYTVKSPFDGAVLAEVGQANSEGVEVALSVAQAAFDKRDQWLSVPERVDILRAVAARIHAEEEALTKQAAHEGGKPYTDSLVEIRRARAGVELCADYIQGHAGEVIPLNEGRRDIQRVAYTTREPGGIVVAVSAFNHPFNLIVHQVATAVAAGCPVIVKPASDTPMSCFALVKMFHEAGLKPEWAQALLTENNQVATQMVTDPRVNFFTFIGSGRVGWSLRSQLAPGTRCAMEHGGVAPLILDRSADLGKAIPAIMKGGFYHAGQVCVSVQKVYVTREHSEAVQRGLVAHAKQLQVGDPLDPNTEVGPLIRQDEVDRVDEWVNEVIEMGAECLIGGEPLGSQLYAPTVLLNPPDEAKVSCEEIFGPVVCVYEYDEVDQAIADANRLNVAFQAAVFAQDIDRAHYIADRLAAAAVMINEHTAYRYDGMPFGGLRHSGLGMGGIGHSIDDMQIEKLKVVTTPVSI